MRILFVTQFFDPEPTFKGMLFAQELRRRGHEVDVLTGYPNYPAGRLYEGWRQRPWHREIVDGVTVTRVPLFPSHDTSALRRGLTYSSFALTAALAATVVRRPDVVYLYHPPVTTGVAAVVLKHLRGVPFVLDVQDLWPDSLTSTGMVHDGLPLRLVGGLVHHVTAAAEHVVTLSPGMTRVVAERSRRPLAVTTIANWTDESHVRPDGAEPRPDHTSEGRQPGRFVVTFAGNLGPAQGLDTVLDAAVLLRDRPDIVLRIVGDGVDAERLHRRALDEGLERVELPGRVPPDVVGAELASADAVLVHLVDEPLFRVTVPSKTQAYLAAGRPVVMAVTGDAADLVTAAGAGVTVAPGDPAALASALRRLADLPREEREALGAAGRRHYQRHLSLRRGTDRFEVVLERASRARPRVDAAKRLGDVVAASLGLALTAPVCGVVALVVALRLGRPVLFRQERPGRDGRPFTLVKFRTLSDARDASGALLDDTARATRLGAVLRTTSLDELPSLWNVLRGDMSLIGPRPLLTRYLPWYTDEERQRFRARPGLSGLAQVRGRNAVAWSERLAHDVDYVRHPSLRQELRLVAATVRVLVRRSGAQADPTLNMADLDVERRLPAAAP